MKDAAVRKYFDQGHLWYFPPPEAFERLVTFANRHGRPEGRPYYSVDQIRPLTGDEWACYRSVFNCPHGYTNVWDRNPVNGSERLRLGNGQSAHLNQKPLDLLQLIIASSSREDDVVWEPFGGLFSACIAAYRLGRRAYGAEIDPTYFALGVERVRLATAHARLL